MSADDMMKLQFNLKFTGKQMRKSSTKCEKEEKAEKNKVKKAIEKGDMEGARIYAQNAIRKKNEALNYLRLSSRIDAVASRVDTAVKMQRVTKAMGAVVKGMDKALQGMNYEHIARVMDQFEKQFETLDVTTEYMDSAIGQTTALTTPEDQVSALMSEIADANGLEFSEQLGGVQAGKAKPQAAAAAEPEDDLAARLAALKKPQ